MRRLTISMLVLIGFLFCFNASSFAAPPTTSGTATFLGTDTTTQGGWQGTYGTVGSYIPNGPSVTPTDGSTFNPGAAALYTWGTNVASGSALKTGGGMNIASCWYRNLGNASPSLTLDVDVPSGSQTVALYLLDYDKQGRSESVSVTDTSGNPLDGPHGVTATNFANGEYLLWKITGEVHITITLVNGPNAVASGIFFGENSILPPPATAGAYITHPELLPLNTSLTGPMVLASLSLPAGTYLIHADLNLASDSGGGALTAECEIYGPSVSAIADGFASIPGVPLRSATGFISMTAPLTITTPTSVSLSCYNRDPTPVSIKVTLAATVLSSVVVQ